MATYFVPVGQKLTLELQLIGAFESVDSITCTLYRLSSVLKKRKTVDTVEAAVEGSKATLEWESKGLDETKEMSCTVYCKLEAGKAKAQLEDEIIVFQPTLKVKALDAENTGNPLPHALCSLEVEADPRWGDRTSPWWGRRARTLQAGIDGTVEFDNLPPGQITLDWHSPFSLKKWTQSKGSEREAQVKRTVVARLSYPAHGTALHRQFVNLTPNGRDLERGPEFVVRVGADANFSAARAGDKIYLKATYHEDNSDRNNPHAKLEGQDTKKGKTITLDKKIRNAGGVVDFRFHLGIAGGDRVTLALGGTKTCSDLEFTVETWRKLKITPVKPNALYPLADDQLPEATRNAVSRAFAQAFLQTDFEEAITVEAPTKRETYGTYELVEVTPDVAERLGLERQTYYVHHSNGSPHSLFREKLLEEGAPDGEPRLHILLGHAIYQDNGRLRVNPELITAESEWIDADQYILPCTFEGKSALQMFGNSWEDSQGHKGKVLPEWVEINSKDQKIRIRLPAEEVAQCRRGGDGGAFRDGETAGRGRAGKVDRSINFAPLR